jgi:nicotinamide N-methyltransferase
MSAAEPTAASLPEAVFAPIRPTNTIYPSFGVGDAAIVYRPPWDPELQARSTHSLPSEICVRIPPAVVNPLFAHRQWRSGLILADAIARGTLDVREKRVLELGAGTALPGIAAALAGARSAVITDYDAADLTRRLRENVRTNMPQALLAERGRVLAMGHTWGTDAEDVLYEPAARAERPFDVVLCADLLWDALSHGILLKTLGAVLAPAGVVHVSAGLHTGRDVLGRFFRLARAAGLEMHGIDGEEEVYEWAVVGDGAELPVEHGTDGFGSAEAQSVRSDLSGERRLFEEGKEEDVKARNGWVVRCVLTRAKKNV